MTWTSVAAGSGPTPHQSNILTGIKVRLGKQPQPLCFCKFPTKGCMQSRFRNSWALYSKIHLWVLQSAHSELVIFFCFSKKKIILLNYRASDSRRGRQLCRGPIWVIGTLAEPGLFWCSAVRLQEEAQRHSGPLHYRSINLAFIS